MTESPLPPFFRIGPERPASPVILSVPHAGRDYGAHLLNATRLRKAVLETLEDRLVDRLIWRATALGMTAFVARAPRLEIDLNREERELDPSLIAPPLPSGGLVQSARTRGGLGLIPSRITGSGPIWRERIPRAELERRIGQIHQPYHAALADALAAARARFGEAVLLDCHSMPPRHRPDNDGERPATIVFGDRHGTTIGADLLDAAIDRLARAGLPHRVQRALCGRLYRRPARPAAHRRPCAADRDRPLRLSRRGPEDARPRLRRHGPPDRGRGPGDRAEAAGRPGRAGGGIGRDDARRGVRKVASGQMRTWTVVYLNLSRAASLALLLLASGCAKSSTPRGQRDDYPVAISRPVCRPVSPLSDHRTPGRPGDGMGLGGAADAALFAGFRGRSRALPGIVETFSPFRGTATHP